MMKIAEMNNKVFARARYSSPKVKVVKTKSQAVLCGSGSITGLNGKDDNPDDWE